MGALLLRGGREGNGAAYKGTKGKEGRGGILPKVKMSGIKH